MVDESTNYFHLGFFSKYEQMKSNKKWLKILTLSRFESN